MPRLQPQPPPILQHGVVPNMQGAVGQLDATQPPPLPLLLPLLPESSAGPESSTGAASSPGTVPSSPGTAASSSSRDEPLVLLEPPLSSPPLPESFLPPLLL